MGFSDDFLTGVAVMIDANGIATWRDTGIYQDDEVAITLGSLPASPADAISLSSYNVADDPSLSDSTLGLQIRTRRDGQDPTPSADTADALFDLFHGAHDYDLSTHVHVVQSLHRSLASGGQDDNDRWSVLQNFYFDLWRPSPHRT